MKITGMKGTMVMPLTLHVEEGSCRVLPGAAPCPALVLPGIGWLHRGEPQHPALNHGLWWQCTCRDTGCHHPCLLRPPTRSRCPPRPQRAPTEPLKAGLGAAGAHAAELGRLPRCHAQLGRLHGGGGGAGGASCSETGGFRAGQAPLVLSPGSGKRGGVAQPAAGCTWSPGMRWVGSVQTLRNPALVTYPVCAPP